MSGVAEALSPEERRAAKALGYSAHDWEAAVAAAEAREQDERFREASGAVDPSTGGGGSTGAASSGGAIVPTDPFQKLVGNAAEALRQAVQPASTGGQERAGAVAALAGGEVYGIKRVLKEMRKDMLLSQALAMESHDAVGK